MNWLDIAIIVVTLSLGMFGLLKGATKAIFGVAGLIGGIVLANYWYKSVANILSPGGTIWPSIVAYAIIVISVLILSAIISQLIKRLISAVMLGWLDRVIGFILGAGIGLALCLAFVAAISRVPGTEGFISHSAIATFLINQFPMITIHRTGQLV